MIDIANLDIEVCPYKGFLIYDIRESDLNTTVFRVSLVKEDGSIFMENQGTMKSLRMMPKQNALIEVNVKWQEIKNIDSYCRNFGVNLSGAIFKLISTLKNKYSSSRYSDNKLVSLHFKFDKKYGFMDHVLYAKKFNSKDKTNTKNNRLHDYKWKTTYFKYSLLVHVIIFMIYLVYLCIQSYYFFMELWSDSINSENGTECSESNTYIARDRTSHDNSPGKGPILSAHIHSYAFVSILSGNLLILCIQINPNSRCTATF